MLPSRQTRRDFLRASELHAAEREQAGTRDGTRALLCGAGVQLRSTEYMSKLYS